MIRRKVLHYDKCDTDVGRHLNEELFKRFKATGRSTQRNDQELIGFERKPGTGEYSVSKFEMLPLCGNHYFELTHLLVETATIARKAVISPIPQVVHDPRIEKLLLIQLQHRFFSDGAVLAEAFYLEDRSAALEADHPQNGRLLSRRPI